MLRDSQEEQLSREGIEGYEGNTLARTFAAFARNLMTRRRSSDGDRDDRRYRSESFCDQLTAPPFPEGNGGYTGSAI